MYICICVCIYVYMATLYVYRPSVRGNVPVTTVHLPSDWNTIRSWILAHHSSLALALSCIKSSLAGMNMKCPINSEVRGFSMVCPPWMEKLGIANLSSAWRTLRSGQHLRAMQLLLNCLVSWTQSVMDKDPNSSSEVMLIRTLQMMIHLLLAETNTVRSELQISVRCCAPLNYPRVCGWQPPPNKCGVVWSASHSIAVVGHESTYYQV